MEEVRDIEELDEAIELCKRYLHKNYLQDITKLEAITTNNTPNKIRILKLKKFVYNEKENNIEKLTSILTAINNIHSTFAYIISSTKKEVSIYLAIKTDNETSIGKDMLYNGLKGNFPGIEIENIYNDEMEYLINDEIFSSNKKCISSSVVIPKQKNDKLDVDIQGIEKFIDSTIGQEYTAIFLAKSLNFEQIENIKNELENIYTLISPFKETSFTFGENESDNVSKTISEGITKGISNTITNTIGTSQSTSKTKGASMGGGLGNSIGTSINAGINAGLDLGIKSIGICLGVGKSVVNSLSVNGSVNMSKTKTESESQSTSDSMSTQDSKNDTTSDTKGYTTGETRTYTFKSENKSRVQLLEKIDNTLKRIQESEDVGMFSFGTYFLAPTKDIAIRLASTYTGLVKGDKSGLETNHINTWDEDNSDIIKNEIKKLEHPLFKDNIEIEVTPTTLITSRELSIGTGFPYRSIPGINSMNFTPFGRNVCTYNKIKGDTINLGNIFHMGEIENRSIDLAIDDLTMHTFITGSTGSGKSNTVYKILDEVNKHDVKFLVIEPAKGEYKDIFGGRDDVNVFGTNPQYSEMLKINPFVFPQGIHILEHIDRLIEIFNACWPMYAAMPAVLKEAVEMAYEKCGWDLDYSICVSSKNIYPTFKDLLNTLDIVIKNSGYSEELKSNYTGALSTRVKSLTNGLLGRVFTSDEIDNKVLFDENTIVDLSRIGSTETKSLITGILFIKLQEYRMTNNVECNSKLKHITVLEEAHNLLRKTSAAQSQEGANLQGKSVEMISNSIAEMRTYGEGFIIADQAPNLLDDSVIRNTNTKIVLRLPQYEDRQSVGKSASLSDEQINEIPKLKTGVAVVYQNNWIEAVLCKVEEFKDKNPLEYSFDVKKQLEKDKKLSGDLLKLLLNGRVTDGNKIDVERIDIDSVSKWLDSKSICEHIKCIINRNFDNLRKEKYMDLWEQDSFDELCEVVNSFVDKNKMTLYSSTAKNMSEWTDMSIEYIRNFIDLNRNIEFEKSLLQCILSNKAKVDEGFKEFYFKWVEDNRVEGRHMI